MLKLYTREYCKRNGILAPIPVSILWESYTVGLIPPEQAIEAVQAIEGTQVVNGFPQAKFTGIGTVPWECISAGCQTALYIAYCNATDKTELISLIESGPVARQYCFTLLTNSKCIGYVTSRGEPMQYNAPVSVDQIVYPDWDSAYVERSFPDV